ncbi:MAG: hypothetical protein D3908_14730, partial [Candidatus Electrothrix sp. AUS4]|nr:hypothetical protein [Candidatus Electrothrix sp. AUS4]
FIVKCDGNIILLEEVNDQEKRDQFFNKVTFVPIFPERKELFYYRQGKEYVFIDTYKENIIGGEVRVFIGTPGKMKQKKLKRVLYHECDKNPIYILDDSKSITPPESVNGILRPHNINGKILGIESDIDGVKGLTKPDITLPCPEFTVIYKEFLEKLEDQPQKSKHRNTYKNKTKPSVKEEPSQSFVIKSNSPVVIKINHPCIPRSQSGMNELKEKPKINVQGSVLRMSTGYTARPQIYCDDQNN